ncbi:MAG: hypothetical protein JW888_04480 [Pirellulales bacterium]|nr:hypothetical protein [Pirellulales bacterium]
MSMLDEAFFKAYGQTNSPPEPKTSKSTRPAPLPKTAGSISAETNSIVDDDESAEPASISLEMLGISIARSRGTDEASTDAGFSSREVENTRRPNGPPEVDERNRPGEPLIAALAEETVEPTEMPASAFRPLLQVDAFAWPPELTTVTPEAEAELEAVAAALLEPNGRRLSVVGLTGSTAEAGCTTLLLGSAGHLARRGLNVVLVDADETGPGLASHLGLLPSLGWEDVVAGRQPLAEVLIESIEDRLTLLPLCNPDQLAQLPNPSCTSTITASIFATLRQNYDIVLLDLGIPGQRITRAMDDLIDAVVLVHDVRRATADDLRSAQAQLARRHIACAGIIENFVSPKSSRSYHRAA